MSNNLKQAKKDLKAFAAVHVSNNGNDNFFSWSEYIFKCTL